MNRAPCLRLPDVGQIDQLPTVLFWESALRWSTMGRLPAQAWCSSSSLDNRCPGWQMLPSRSDPNAKQNEEEPLPRKRNRSGMKGLHWMPIPPTHTATKPASSDSQDYEEHQLLIHTLAEPSKYPQPSGSGDLCQSAFCQYKVLRLAFVRFELTTAPESCQGRYREHRPGSPDT